MTEKGDEVIEALRRVVGRLPDGGEARRGQEEMTAAVAAAIARGRHLAVEAGTGTGKSVAYLVAAVCSKRKVVVATATKALQDQLAGKDVPLVQAALGRFRFAVLKGRANYLCVQRLVEARDEGRQGRLGDEEGSAETRSSQGARAIFEWAKTTTSGDRAELESEPEGRLWSAFSVTSDECPGARRCPSGKACFAERARDEAAAADVVAVNLHLLGSDLAHGGGVLPDHEVLVVDEAHALEDVVSESLGAAIGAGRLRAAAAGVRAATRRRRGGSEQVAVELFEIADRLDKLLEGLRGRRLADPLEPELSGLLARARSVLERAEAALGGRAAGDEQTAIRAGLACRRLRGDLDRLTALGDEDVAWVEEGERRQIRLAPIEVAPVLKAELFSKSTVVLTSATLSPGLATHLGAEEAEVDELDVGSPFDYRGHALLYCAADLPDRRSEGAEAAISDELEALITAAGGRTLALFTSHGAMGRAAETLRRRVAYPILVQGELAKAVLIRRFCDEEEACLFATMGFWQGVDIPGATLSLVVIDRIPFPRPDDPLVSARRDRAGRDAFRTIDLPRAATLLAQGAGRLIRSGEDRGVVAVLDPRLAAASYRWALVRALPPMRRTRRRDEAVAFLRALASQ